MARENRSWLRRHWRLVVLVLGAVIAGIAIGALCATPAGASVVAAVASIKLFAAVATMSAPALFFVMGGLTTATVLAAGALFNAAVWVSNWLDRKIGHKKTENYPDPEVGNSWCCISKKTNHKPANGTKTTLHKPREIYSPDAFMAQRNAPRPANPEQNGAPDNNRGMAF